MLDFGFSQNPAFCVYVRFNYGLIALGLTKDLFELLINQEGDPGFFLQSFYLFDFFW
jgi:hypothetical protein